MSDLTYQQALDLLQGDPAQFDSVQALYNLASSVNVDAVGDVTILYGGQPANGIKPQKIFDSMELNGDSIRVLDNTDAAKFLGSQEFRESLASIYGLSKVDLESKPTELSPAKQLALETMNNSLYHATNGPWAEASGRFVDATVGEIRTLTGGAAADRTFALVEVPRALANNKITHIDGLACTDLVEVGSTNAFKAISAQSNIYSAEIKVAVHSDGSILNDSNGLPRVDSRGFLNATGLEGKAPLDDVGNYRNLAEFMPHELRRPSAHTEGAAVLIDIKAGYEAQAHLPGTENAALRAGALKALDKLGWAGDLLALGLVATEANAAYAEGDQARADALLNGWAIDFTGGLAGGLLAAKMVGSALAPLYLTGPVGAAVAGGLTLAAGFAGAIGGGWLLGESAEGAKELLDKLRANFNKAQQTISPLVLDLDGINGAETISQTAGIHFDHDANQFAEQTGWVGKNDGLLVWDRNANGQIDNGGELFGNHTVLASGENAAHGFVALAELDANQDGVVNIADAAFANLRVFKDANSNGVVDAGELLTLAQAGVKSLNTAYSDELNGRGGADTLWGGQGNDTYYVDHAGDLVIELAGQGDTDQVISTIGYTLPDHVEQLSLLTHAHVNLTGNALNNKLTGQQGDNVLDGKEGADTLRGYGGNDTYVIDNVGDTITELANEGTLDVAQLWTSFSFLALSANRNAVIERIEVMGNDALSATGNGKGQQIVGNGAANELRGGGGADTILGQGGDDRLILGTAERASLGTSSYDGGEGLDTLALASDQSGVFLDFTAYGANSFTGIERLDLAGGGNNTAKLTIDRLLQMPDAGEDKLIVLGNAGDAVQLAGGPGNWSSQGTQSWQGLDYSVYAHSGVVGRELFVQQGITVM